MSSGLSESAVDLLPSGDTSPKCSTHARQIATDPCGTAISAHAIILVEVPLPWPKPVFDHPLLKGFQSISETSLGTTRVLAMIPRTEEPGTEILVYQRDEVGMKSWGLRLHSASQLVKFASDIQTKIPQYPDTSAEKVNPPELAVVVCTQGSHDICCGSEGARLANELERRAPGLNVLRVSHTGGHRFAPTAMTIPDGRMWAYLDPETTLSILELTGDPSLLSPKCRGWLGAATGPGQVAERAIFEQLGWELDLLPRELEVREIEFGWAVSIWVARQEWLVEVRRGREVPTISCRANGGLPAKPSYEYIVTEIHPPGELVT
ncbi:MAG: sucrase ferredoxin [Acidimicrobiales bacterium]|nr:sucrase ferredoxin [Acidimicrobiales bacterium]